MYKDYTFLNTDHFARFGGFWSGATNAGVFCLRVNASSATSNAAVGSRLIMFGD